MKNISNKLCDYGCGQDGECSTGNIAKIVCNAKLKLGDKI